MDSLGPLHFAPANPNSAPVLRELIALGPRALPFLLADLDDRTPTRLVVRHSTWGAGGMDFYHGIWINPVNAAERRVLASAPGRWRTAPTPGELVQIPAPPGKPWETTLAYTATVGDVCLVEIGQIVARPYAAISYMPTASIDIDSPSHDPALAAQVRAIWSSKHPAQHLLDSLLLDYSTEGIFDGKTLDSETLGSDLQVDAAMRLLYYFPRQSAPLIAARLRRLNVSAYSGEGWTLREVSNGVSTNRFIQAAALCQEPAIRSALLGIFQRTTDPEILVSALPGIGQKHARLVRSRVSAFLDHRPPYVGRALGDEFNLLYAYVQWATSSDAKAVFKRYLDHASIERCRNVCRLLRDIPRGWDLELLAPLLNDQRPAGWTYSVDPKQREPQLPVRVCDEAAETLAKNHPDLSFTLAGTHADLDRQIAAMRARVSMGER